MGALFEAERVSRTVIKPAAGFRAELPGLDLATLIQMTCARRERLVVRVSSYGEEEGYLYSADGALFHATVGTLVGDEAVLRMLAWPTGEFSLCERPFPLRPTIESSTEGLLLRAAQRIDEAALDLETDLVLEEELGPEVSLAEQLEGRDEDEPSAPPARPPAPSKSPSRPPPIPASLPPVSLGRLSEPPPRRSEPVRRASPPPPPVPSRSSSMSGIPDAGSSLLACVRLDPRGDVVGAFGSDEQLAQLVAYVSRIAALVQADFALDPFDALHAELSGKRVLIFQDGRELVGLVMKPSSAAQELRQRLGV